MRSSSLLRALNAVGLSVAVVGLLYAVPSFALATLARWPGYSGDPWYLAFALQAALLVMVVRVLRLPVRRALAAPATVDGLRAVFWLLCGGVWLGLLLSLGAVAADVPAGGSQPGALRDLAGKLPASGVAGGTLRDFALNPIFEELVFRVCVLGLLLRALPAWAALVISSTLFGALHPTPVALVIGIAFGLLYLRYASAQLCIVAHVLWNILVAFGVPLAVSQLLESGWFLGIAGNVRMVQVICLAASLGCFLAFLRVLGEKREQCLPSTLQPQ